MTEHRRTEADVEPDDARVDSRDRDDENVGRIAADDPETEESGAERRAEE